MKPFEYGDQEIGENEILYLVASIIIAVGILSLPRHLAKVTNFSDGWVSLMIGGIIAIFFTGITAKLASRFPNQTFFMYASSLCTKPVAYLLTIWFAIHFIAFTSYETRVIAIITSQYLIERTPFEVISLLFLLVLVYAVSGSRVGVIRLNLLFLPIILFFALLVLILDIRYFEVSNLFPLFTTSWKGYWVGVKESYLSLSGWEILFFYTAFVNRSKKVPKYAMAGVLIPLGLYLVVYIMSIGVFSFETTATIYYPFIELAKEATVPGGFFERFEWLFFTIWIMAIFNTASLSFDIALMAVGSLFQKVKKITIIFILAPIIYLISMFPQDSIEVTKLADYLSYSSIVIAMLLPTGLLLLAKLRGIKGNV